MCVWIQDGQYEFLLTHHHPTWLCVYVCECVCVRERERERGRERKRERERERVCVWIQDSQYEFLLTLLHPMWQNTATHSNTFATHCNTLQHVATCCNTLQHSERDTLQHSTWPHRAVFIFPSNTHTHTHVYVCVCA